jgi:leukotriene-A4 hydrolase
MSTEHISLQLTLDFSAKRLAAVATLHMRMHNPASCGDSLRLDARGLDVVSVHLLHDSAYAHGTGDEQPGTVLEFTVERTTASPTPLAPVEAVAKGAEMATATGDGVLSIRLPEKGDTRMARGSLVKIAVTYSTDGCGGGAPAGGACAWLEPEQTAGRKHPYVFTQCQAIHARSILPCQDSPSVKASYDAAITVEYGGGAYQLTAVMAALAAPRRAGDPPNVFRFKQPRPVPSYLIAFAAGDLRSRDLSPRCRVWAEPSVVDRAADEFCDTEKILACAEGIAGPYLWERYDLLCMPPSFPYGGMENANLTFVTPTLLAGDRSLVSVIAHEIAHSWAGNLVSCADWSSFWCNEGFTVFLERAILRHLYGKPRADLSACNGRRELVRYIESVGKDHNYTRLVPQLQPGSDPDDAFSIVPYEKGFQFLKYLEHVIGESGESDRAVADFEALLRDWFQKHAFQSISSSDFIEFFSHRYPASAGMVDVGAWLHQPGLVPCEVQLDRSLTDEATALARRWVTATSANTGGDIMDAYAAFSASDLSGWSAPQVITFLNELYTLVNIAMSANSSAWTSRDVERMAELYGFDAQTNAEVRFLWCRLGLTGESPAAVEHTCKFLLEQGRMKYIRPLYKDLHETYPKGCKSKDLFVANQHLYHPIAAKMVAACFKESQQAFSICCRKVCINIE